MVFTSQVFLFWFLPLVLAGYYLLPARARSAVLVLASYVFYGWWRFDFLFLILFSTVVDFRCGARIAALHDERAGADEDADRALDRRQRRWVAVSAITNLGLLAWFKYANFGVETLNALLGHYGHEPVAWTRVVLPVGISFYTFQTMSYTIDVYRRQAPRVRSFLDFAAYVALFPQLVAGPIVRYRSIADQLRQRTHGLARFSTGVLLFQIGFAKKLLIADTVAPVVTAAFAQDAPTPAVAWAGALAYTLQLYFDFSGYSDMALGLGRMFGFTFPINFDAPYKAASITEFWRRWHITLGAWLRDYLYIPLGGNRKGRVRTGINLALTMLLGGLWHGAAWTFVAWGAWHGAWLMIERAFGGALWRRLPRPLAVATTLLVVIAGWVAFRAGSLEQAGAFLAAMAGVPAAGATGDLDPDLLAVLAAVAGILVTFLFAPSQDQVDRARWWLVALAPPAFLLGVALLLHRAFTPFLYFQF